MLLLLYLKVDLISFKKGRCNVYSMLTTRAKNHMRNLRFFVIVSVHSVTINKRLESTQLHLLLFIVGGFIICEIFNSCRSNCFS